MLAEGRTIRKVRRGWGKTETKLMQWRVTEEKKVQNRSK